MKSIVRIWCFLLSCRLEREQSQKPRPQRSFPPRASSGVICGSRLSCRCLARRREISPSVAVAGMGNPYLARVDPLAGESIVVRSHCGGWSSKLSLSGLLPLSYKIPARFSPNSLVQVVRIGLFCDRPDARAIWIRFLPLGVACAGSRSQTNSTLTLNWYFWPSIPPFLDPPHHCFPTLDFCETTICNGD